MHCKTTYCIYYKIVMNDFIIFFIACTNLEIIESEIPLFSSFFDGQNKFLLSVLKSQ